MSVNEGTIDRVVRVVVAAVLFFLIFSGIVSGLWAWIAGVVGVAALITGALGFCGIYALVGASTCPTPKAKG